MMAAALADGKTILSNVSKEPEVADLAHFLTRSGASIEGVGSDMLFIKGKRKLNGPKWYITPDRIEAGTFMLAAAITRSCISLSPVVPSQLSCLIHKLSSSGCKITQENHDTLVVSASMNDIGKNLQSFDVKTGPYPGFPTDLQPQTMALLTTCDSSSTVEETVFDQRMGHVSELMKLGARINVCGNTALVLGKERGSVLYGSRIVAKDLRGGISLVLAGLAAEGTTEISNAGHIYRGYENLDLKLRSLGAKVNMFAPAAYPA